MICILDLTVGRRYGVVIEYLYNNVASVKRVHTNITKSSSRRIRRIANDMHPVAGGENGATYVREMPDKTKTPFDRRKLVIRQIDSGEIPF